MDLVLIESVRRMDWSEKNSIPSFYSIPIQKFN